MLNPVLSSGAADEDRELWVETLKDPESGFTTGPYSVEEFGKIQGCSCEQSYSLLLDSVWGSGHVSHHWTSSYDDHLDQLPRYLQKKYSCTLLCEVFAFVGT